MSHLNTAYKLGELKAAEDFASWIRDLDHDNPTQAPPKTASVADVAVAHVLEKLGAPRKKKLPGKKAPISSGASRKPLNDGSRFKTLKKALKKKRRNRHKQAAWGPVVDGQAQLLHGGKRLASVPTGGSFDPKDPYWMLQHNIIRDEILNNPDVKPGWVPTHDIDYRG